MGKTKRTNNHIISALHSNAAGSFLHYYKHIPKCQYIEHLNANKLGFRSKSFYFNRFYLDFRWLRIQTIFAIKVFSAARKPLMLFF